MRLRIEANEHYAQSRRMEADLRDSLEEEELHIEPAPFDDEYEVNDLRGLSDLREEFDSALGELDDIPGTDELPAASDRALSFARKSEPGPSRGAKTKDSNPAPAAAGPIPAVPTAVVQAPKDQDITSSDSKKAPESVRSGPKEMKGRDRRLSRRTGRRIRQKKSPCQKALRADQETRPGCASHRGCPAGRRKHGSRFG